MKATLVVKKGSTKAQVIQLRSRNTLIGRMQGCDVRIPSKAVSRHHAKVRIKYDYLMVEDLDSANGTFVNGERIDGRQVIHPGDQLQIGPVVFVVKYQLSDAGAENIGGDETVMRSMEIEPVEEAEDEAAEPVELEVVEDEEEDDADARPVTKDTTTSSPSLGALQKQQKKKTTKTAPPEKGKPKDADEKQPAAKKKDDKKGADKKKPEPKEREDDSTPDSSQILDGRRWDPPAGDDLRSLFSDMEDE